MGSFFDTISGNKDARKNTRRARNMAGFDPFSFSGFGADTSITGEGINLSGGAGSSLAPGFEGLAQRLLGGAGANIPAGLGFGVGNVVGGAMRAGRGGQGFLDAAGGVLGGISSFNPDEFAANRFSMLQNLARPGEERAAGSLASRLFSRGRFGGEDTSAGRAFGELDQAQSQAETMRFLQSQDAATQELQGRIGAAGGLAQTGMGINQSGIQNFLAAIGGGIQTSGAEQNIFNTLLGGAGQATTGIRQAFAPSRDAIQTLLAGSGMQRQTDLAQANIQAGFDPTRGAEAASGAAGGFIGGLFSDLALKDNIVELDKDEKGRTLYGWSWNETAKELGIDKYPTVGYIAQELLGSDPEAVRVGPGGYLMVDTEAL